MTTELEVVFAILGLLFGGFRFLIFLLVGHCIAAVVETQMELRQKGR